MTRRILLLSLALVLLVGCHPTPRQPASTPTTSGSIQAGRPRSDITPGAVLTSSRVDVCTPGWASKHRRSLTVKQKAAVLASYGYPAGQKVAEWDHLISLELGGGNGTRNIWPQVNHAEDQRKDRLENRLHAQVCAGRLDLPKAQDEIRQYWIWW